MNDKINLSDLKDTIFKRGEDSRGNSTRKIKLKNTTITNVVRLFNDFRLKLLKNELKKTTEKVLDTTLKESDLRRDFTNSPAESILSMGADKIARLESKIVFLESGMEVPATVVKKRAIKLTDAMWNNIQTSANRTLKVPNDKKAKVLEEADDIHKIIEEETGKLHDKVNEQSLLNAVNSQIKTPGFNVEDVDSSQTQNAVNDGFEEEQKNSNAFENVSNFIKMKEDSETMKKEDTNDEITAKPIVNLNQINQDEIPKISRAGIGLENFDSNKALNSGSKEMLGTGESQLDDTEEDVYTEEAKFRDIPVVAEERDEKSNQNKVTLDELYNLMGKYSLEDHRAMDTIKTLIRSKENDTVEESNENVDYLEKTADSIRDLDNILYLLENVNLKESQSLTTLNKLIKDKQEDILEYRQHLTDEDEDKLSEMFESGVMRLVDIYSEENSKDNEESNVEMEEASSEVEPVEEEVAKEDASETVLNSVETNDNLVSDNIAEVKEQITTDNTDELDVVNKESSVKISASPEAVDNIRKNSYQELYKDVNEKIQKAIDYRDSKRKVLEEAKEKFESYINQQNAKVEELYNEGDEYQSQIDEIGAMFEEMGVPLESDKSEGKTLK